MNDPPLAGDGPETKKPVKLRSMSRRLAAAITGAAVLVSFVTVMGLYFNAIREQEAILTTKAEQSRDYLVGALELPLWNYDNNIVKSISRTFSQNELVVKLVVWNAAGDVIYEFSRNGEMDVITKKGKVVYREEAIGEITISFTKRFIEESGRDLLASYATTIAFVSLSIVLITGFFVRLMLKRPIDTLNAMIRPYATGIYDLPVPQIPYAEFQAFGTALSRMGETIKLQMGAITDAEEKYRGIFENAVEGIFQCTPEGRYLSANPAYARIHGYASPQDLLNSAVSIEQHFAVQDDWVRFRKAIEEDGHLPGFECERHRKDGIKITVSINARTVSGGKGVARYFEGSMSDITARRQAEKELHRYQDQLEETVKRRTAELLLARDAAEAANKAKSVFLANMSHELRTPLNAILGFSAMLSHEPDLGEGQREKLDIINRSGDHLLRLINDVLEMAKIEAGRMQVEAAPFDLGALIRETTDMMRQRASEKGLQLRLDQSSKFPRYVRGDAARLRQVLLNLVGNAVKFTTEGEVTVRLGVKQNAADHLLIEIEDTGPGISPEDQKRLFRPFVQLTEGGEQKGTGLGLVISLQYLQLMGGTIELESEVGKGSIFRVELPLERAAEAEISGLPPPARLKEITGLAPGQPAWRILIAEDEPDNQMLLAELMAKLGLEVRIAENGERAVQMFQEWRPHLIWMDYHWRPANSRIDSIG